MEGKTQHAIVLQKEGKTPVYKEFPIKKLEEGELLIKVQGSTVNPSDRAIIDGYYPVKRPLPLIMGLEGTGTVVQAKGQAVKTWIGKRVSFKTYNGSWCEYSVATPDSVFEIQKDVPLSSAASGVINPLTAIGFVQSYKALGGKGIIHTAAASALGKMLNKLCIKQKIPLLCLVRKQDQAQQLKKQGATHVIVTTGDWQKQYRQIVQKEGLNVVFDALGGGPVTEVVITNLNPNSTYHIYGKLEKGPFILNNPGSLFVGVIIKGFHLDVWWGKASKEIHERVRKQYSSLLKNQLSTKTFKELGLKQIEEALDLSVKNSSQGKIFLKF